MKTSIPVITLSLMLVISGCRKRVEYVYMDPPTPPKALAERLPGEWSASFVSYSAQIDLSSQGLPPVTVAGITENPNGNVKAEKEPKNMTFQLQFSASIDIGFGFPIPIPVNINSSGTYSISADEKTITMTPSSGGNMEFRVLTNEFNVQVWRTTYPLQIPLLGTLPMNMIITFVKKSN